MTSRRSGAGCLAVIAVPFLIVGIYSGFAAVGATRGGMSRLAFVFVCASVAFGGAGLAMIAGAFREKPYPQTAGTNRIHDHSSGGTLMLWGFALVWNAIASSLLLFLPEAVAKGTRLAWAGVLFLAVGVVLLFVALRATLRLLRFRGSTLVLDGVPVPIGGVLRGTVEVPNALSGVSAVTLRLNSVSRIESRNSSTVTILCREEREVDVSSIRLAGTGAAIPIEIAVPGDASPTGEQESWQLAVDAELPGVDYSATFEVPVAATSFTEFRPHLLTGVAGMPQNPRSYFEREGPEGHELLFPAFRAPMMALWALCCTLLAVGATLFTIGIEAPVALTILFGFVTLPMVISTLDLFFVSRAVILAPDRLLVRKRFLLSSENPIPYGNLASVRAVPAASSGARPCYHIDLRTKDGKRFRVARYIRSKREADWVASRIQRGMRERDSE